MNRMRFKAAIISAVLLVAVLAVPASAIYNWDVWEFTQKYMKLRLIRPDTAVFSPPPWLNMNGLVWTDYGDGECFMRAWVTSLNAQDQEIKTFFTAYVGTRNGELYMKEFRAWP